MRITAGIYFKSLLRLVAIVIGLALLTMVPFAIWGDRFGDLLSVDGAVTWLRGTGWAWAAGIGLIVADTVLPVPSTAVMAALGVLYGPAIGGILSATGSILAGVVSYWLCRALGPRTAEWLAGREGLAEAQRLFRRWGFWLIAISRWLPVLPEAVAMLSGLIRVSFVRFLAALAFGAVPLGFVFATAGHLGKEAPVVVIVICAVAPLVMVGLIRYWRARYRA